MSEHSSYDPAFFSLLFEVEDRHFWFRARNQVISELVAQTAAGFEPGYHALEVGCGTGNVLRVLEPLCHSGHVIGMDLFLDGLRYARRRVSCPLTQGDLHSPPFARRFSMIAMFDVLEHLPDDIAVLRSLLALLSPSGTLLLTVPAHMSLWSYFDEASHHVRRYTLPELDQKLIRAGYRVEYMSYYMMSIFPLVWMGRKLTEINGRTTRHTNGASEMTHEMASRELKIIPGVNRILGIVSKLEARVIKRRGRFPVGTSLVAVARKG